MMSCIAPKTSKNTIGTTNLESSDIMWYPLIIDRSESTDHFRLIIPGWCDLPFLGVGVEDPQLPGFLHLSNPGIGLAKMHFSGVPEDDVCKLVELSETSNKYFTSSDPSDPHPEKMIYLYGWFTVSLVSHLGVSFTGSSGFKFGFHLKGFNQSFLGCRLGFL